MIAKISFTIYEGESLPVRLVVSEDGNGAPVSTLSGYSVKVDLYDGDETECVAPLLTKSTTAGTITTVGNAALWVWTAEECHDFPARTRFRVSATDDGGNASVIATGNIKHRCQ
jgi:hypothetical protein